MSKFLYVDIPDELDEQLRQHCFRKRLSKKKIVTDALALYLTPRPQILTSKPDVMIGSKTQVAMINKMTTPPKKDGSMPFEL